MARAKTGPRRLKALLPPDTIVAHKTGTTDVVINDVGIITLPPDSAMGGHIALVVFVINGGRASTMQQTIAQIAGASYEFFTGKPLPTPQKARAPTETARAPAEKARTRRRLTVL
jgi:beta-lactamase class A